MMRSSAFALLALLVSGLLSGCMNMSSVSSEEDETAALYTADAQYYNTEGVDVMLVNQMDATISYNLCRAALQRKTGETWSAVSTDREECPSIIFRLAPTETAAYTFTPEVPLESGEYRFLATVQVGSEKTTKTFASPPFAISHSSTRPQAILQRELSQSSRGESAPFDR